jgi:retron-type reverse transcriptase
MRQKTELEITLQAVAEHWPALRAQLLEGTYKPQPVRRVEIPKASGGTRSLGIPTVLDRFIQQAVLQVLQAEWDPTFSEHSFGFRPKRSAHQAVARAQELIASGHDIVVDIDLPLDQYCVSSGTLPNSPARLGNPVGEQRHRGAPPCRTTTCGLI